MKNRLLSILLVFMLLLSTATFNTGFAAELVKNNDIKNLGSDAESLIVKEDVSLRGEYEKHFICKDGSYIAASYQEPVCYMDGKGNWVNVDNSLIENNGRLENKSSQLHVSFAKKANDEEMIRLSNNGAKMSWSLSFSKNDSESIDMNNTVDNIVEFEPQESKAKYIRKPVSDESLNENEKQLSCENLSSSVTYPSLNRSTEAQYTVFSNRIKENIVLNEKTDLTSYSMNVKCDGLTPALNENNEVEFIDEDGNVQYCIQTPYMYDDLYELSYDIKIAILEVENGYKITFYPDLNWLNSEERVYPITLDPSVKTGTNKVNFSDTYIYQGDSASSSRCFEERLRVGIYNDKVYRVFWKTSKLPTISSGSNITSAKFVLKLPDTTTTSRNFSIYQVKSSWTSETITWSKASNFSYTKLQSDVKRDTANDKVTFNGTNLTNVVKGWYKGDNNGFVIRYTNEDKTNPDYNLFYSSDNTTSTSYMPTLTINYSAPEGDSSNYKNFTGILKERVTINGISLPVGTPMRHGLRYISQEGAPGYSGSRIDSVNFKSEYWGSYSSYAGCAVASTSVALFTLGKNKLPKDICSINAKYGDPVFMQWSHVATATGCKYADVSTSNIDTYLNRYLDNPLKYSAPIVKINKTYSHYVVIVGKNSNGTYKALDPSSHTAKDYNDGCTRVLQYYV